VPILKKNYGVYHITALITIELFAAGLFRLGVSVIIFTRSASYCDDGAGKFCQLIRSLGDETGALVRHSGEPQMVSQSRDIADHCRYDGRDGHKAATDPGGY
jgi:hypothetical protein